jgi:hypothetical protein
MLSYVAGSALFLSSYAPLFAILSFENVGMHNYLALAFGILTVLGLAGVKLIIHESRRDTTSIPDRVVSCQEHGDELMGYVSAYLIPFFDIDFSDWRHVVVLGAFLLLLGYLYVTTATIYVNPLLRPLGYRVYEVVLERCGAQRMISKRALVANDRVEVVLLVHKVVIEGVKR